MKTYPPVPRVDDAPADLLASGHLWIQERIDGAHLRFQLLESGVLRFGDRRGIFDPDDVPAQYRHAVRHVRENLDREALRSAVDDIESIVFFAEATHRQTIGYDWARTPSALGFDVWSGEKGRFLPPDAVERIFSELELRSVNAFAKEVRASDFDPGSYEVPASAWYDGPAAGVVVRDKTGGRATIPHPDFEREVAGSDDTSTGSGGASAAELTAEYATRELFDRIARELADRGRPVTVDALYERTLEAIFRDAHRRILGETSDVDARAFRSEVAALAGRYVEKRD